MIKKKRIKKNKNRNGKGIVVIFVIFRISILMMDVPMVFILFSLHMSFRLVIKTSTSHILSLTLTAC